MTFPTQPLYSEGFNGKFPLFEMGYDPHKWAMPPITQKPRIIINPVPIAFWPSHAIKIDDSKEHEGVSFAELWADPVARTLWLAHKRFMITSQYFRLRCIQEGYDLRRRPERLLRERIGFQIEQGLWLDDYNYEIGSQLGPYLAWALQREGKWPYFRTPATELRWKYEKAKARC